MISLRRFTAVRSGLNVAQTNLFTRSRCLVGNCSRRGTDGRHLQTLTDGAVARRAVATIVGGGCGRRRLGRRGCQPTGVEIHGHRHHGPKGERPESVGRPGENGAFGWSTNHDGGGGEGRLRRHGGQNRTATPHAPARCHFAAILRVTHTLLNDKT